MSNSQWHEDQSIGARASAREEKRRALRDAVVEAADRYVARKGYIGETHAEETLDRAVRALRAHERGE